MKNRLKRYVVKCFSSLSMRRKLIITYTLLICVLVSVVGISTYRIAITKLDSNAKGGVAISVAHETKIPIMLAGLGEKVEDLVDFDPVYFVDSIFES